MIAQIPDCEVHHPGVQHSATLAAALLTHGRLSRLVTRLQIGAHPRQPWQSVTSSSRMQGILRRRVKPFLPDAYITRHHAAVDIAQSVLFRYMRAPDARARVATATGHFFASSAAKTIDPTTRFLIAPSYAARLAFAHISRRGLPVRKVLDVSHPFPSQARALVAEDAAYFGFPTTSYDEEPDTNAQSAYLLEELATADLVLAASKFTASSLLASGLSADKLHVVPYGVPLYPGPPNWDVDASQELRLVFVGALSERKGISLLLRAMETLSSRGATASLTLIGSPAVGWRPPKRWPRNVVYLPTATMHTVRRAMREAHYLVLPSICEGFGVVLIEALASGTGVITTERSAGPDLAAAHPAAPILIIPATERVNLAQHLERLAAHVAEYGVDRRAARRAGEQYSLEHYGRRVSAVLS